VAQICRSLCVAYRKNVLPICQITGAKVAFYSTDGQQNMQPAVLLARHALSVHSLLPAFAQAGRALYNSIGLGAGAQQTRPDPASSVA
jgi:hypothetical protein